MAVIALDMGGTRIKFGLVEENHLVSSAIITVPSSENFGALLPGIERQIDNMIREAGKQDIDGIGMAFPTIVDSQNNRLLYKYVKYNDANDLDLGAWALEKWNAPLAMENDARAALLGEWKWGAGQGIDNLVMVTIGTGIGTAALLNGQLVRGAHFLASNLGGHTVINLDGVTCNCGNTGCVESEASSWALHGIIKRWRGYENSSFSRFQDIDFETLFSESDRGDLFAREIMNHCLHVWATTVVNLIYSYDPECIILGGGVMKRSELIIPLVKEKISNAAWLPEGAYEVVSAQEPDWAGVLGMAYMAMQASKQSA